MPPSNAPRAGAPPAPHKLFRAAALKQINSPEDLDRLIHVTRPIGWVAGLALALMLGGVVAWSILGELPSRVSGHGLLLPRGGRVVEVQARGNGVLVSMLVTVGDRVEAGQPLARLERTEGARELSTLRAQRDDRARELALAEAAVEAEQRARGEGTARQRSALELRIEFGRAREATLRERLSSTEALFRQQLVTRNQLIGVQNELASTRQDLSNAASDLARLDSETLELGRSQQERLRERRRQLQELESRIADTEAQQADELVLRATEPGVVVELRSGAGMLVRQGQALLALEQQGDGLEMAAFVESQFGKQLQPGMEARIAVSSARREHFGMLIGDVTSVSDFPLSLEALRAIIHNDALAQSFMRAGPPFLVRLAMQRDPTTLSGYRWTSDRGEAVTLSSGIPSTVEIITGRRRPITLVIPALREWLSL
jgi:HlyD family secretion protein